EGIEATDDGKEALIELAEGDMRKVLNVLQSVASAHSVVSEATVYRSCGVPVKSEIETILRWLVTGHFAQIYHGRRSCRRFSASPDRLPPHRHPRSSARERVRAERYRRPSALSRPQR